VGRLVVKLCYNFGNKGAQSMRIMLDNRGHSSKNCSQTIVSIYMVQIPDVEDTFLTAEAFG
jgi:hypothetical protein